MKPCAWQMQVGPKVETCPEPAAAGSMFCTDHREYGWGKGHAENRRTGRR